MQLAGHVSRVSLYDPDILIAHVILVVRRSRTKVGGYGRAVGLAALGGIVLPCNLTVNITAVVHSRRLEHTALLIVCFRWKVESEI